MSLYGFHVGRAAVAVDEGRRHEAGAAGAALDLGAARLNVAVEPVGHYGIAEFGRGTLFRAAVADALSILLL
jgi:hypothetical protein